MANANSKILTAEQELKLRKPIDEYVGKIQKQIDSLRADGTDKVVSIQNQMDSGETRASPKVRKKTGFPMPGKNWKRQKQWRQRTKMRLPS